MSLSTTKEGVLRKSHQGHAAKMNPRYFVSSGFHVMYFESAAMKTRHGRLQHGQSGRLGGVTAGHHRLLWLHLKA